MNNSVLKILEVFENGDDDCEHDWIQEVNGEMFVDNKGLLKFKAKRKCSKCGRYELILKSMWGS